MSTTSSSTVGKNAEDMSVWTQTDTIVLGAGALGTLFVGWTLSVVNPPFGPMHLAFCLNVFAVLCLLYFYFNGTDRLVNSLANKTTVATLVMILLGFNVAMQTIEKAKWSWLANDRSRGATGGYMF